jgi:hypothetical protein
LGEGSLLLPHSFFSGERNMIYKVKKIRIMVSSENGVMRLGQNICPYELPLFYMGHGQDLVDVEGPVDEVIEIESISEETIRLKQQYGEGPILELFGHNPELTIKAAVEQAVEKQEVVNGSKNTSKSKDGASTEARV